MTPVDFRELIEQIEAQGVTLYKLAGLIELRLGRRFQYIQVERIRETGRCEHFVGEILREIHRDLVPSLQIVPRPLQMLMRTA